MRYLQHDLLEEGLWDVRQERDAAEERGERRGVPRGATLPQRTLLALYRLHTVTPLGVLSLRLYTHNESHNSRILNRNCVTNTCS